MKDYSKFLLSWACLLLTAMPVFAQNNDDDDDDEKPKKSAWKMAPDKQVSSADEKDDNTPLDTVAASKRIMEWQEAQESDSVALFNDEPEPYYIGLLSRGYNDRIVLRWAPSEYVPWRVLNSAGYVVERVNVTSGMHHDTLAIVKPWPIEKFKQKFAEEDSLAGVAVQLIYGGAETNLSNTQTPPGSGSMGGIVEVYDEQQSVVGMAMMVAELRPDLAEAMGLLYVDRQAKPDEEYAYFVLPNIPDSIITIQNDPVLSVKLGSYKPEPFSLAITDSLSAPSTVILYWSRDMYSAVDIERQDTEGGPWKKLNERPYVSLTALGDGQLPDNGMNMFRDNLPKVGTYRYRFSGYDSFGDRSEPSAPYEVEMPDMVPPLPPSIKNIVVDHPDEKHAYATIYFHVDTVEADVKGYLPLYRHNRVKNGDWHPLTMNFTAPGDSVMKVDVSGLPTGQLSIAAYDNAGNQGASIPQMILLEDYLAPSAPTGLKANVAPDGYLLLSWNPSPEPDVAFYEVFSGNGPDELFVNRSNDQQTDTVFADSLALGVNQAYIYYKVRAVDYSGNASKDSEMLRVARPNYIPPSVCRVDSVWVTDDAINIWWIQSNEADLDYHRLFRKLQGEELWTLMGVYRADSLRMKGDRIRFKDSPKPNMRKRYVYAVETVNLSGVTSGLSQTQSILFTGPRTVNISIKLYGSYTKEGNETRLTWERGHVPEYGPWHYNIFRKGKDDKDFKFLLAAKSDETQFTDYLLRPGQEAEYYVTIMYDDGRRSQRSNVVKVSAPKEN